MRSNGWLSVIFLRRIARQQRSYRRLFREAKATRGQYLEAISQPILIQSYGEVFMKVIFRILLLPYLVATCATFAVSQAPSGELKLPPHRRAKLENGMTLLLMEQHEVPLISFRVVIRSGAVADPTGKEGVASITAELLRKGTKARSA